MVGNLQDSSGGLFPVRARGSFQRRNYMWRKRVFLLVALVTLISLPVAAQVTTADVLGRVVDPKGLAVPSAKVTLANSETGFSRETTTSDSGDFAITLIPVGIYKLTIEKEGFATTVYEKVELFVGQKLTLDIALKVGGAREIVTVTEQPPLI